jgi:hypothetical protein
LDGDTLGSVRNLDDFVSGGDFSFLQNSEVETRPVVGDKQSRHCWHAHSDAYAITGHARLGHLKDRAADPVTISNAYLVIGQAVDRKVLAELTVVELATAKVGLPIAIRVHLVDHHRAVFSSVAGEISLSVSIYV